jgi:hypothetical protein
MKSHTNVAIPRDVLESARLTVDELKETKVFMPTGNLALGGAAPLDYVRTPACPASPQP